MTTMSLADPAFLENPFPFYTMGRQLGVLQAGPAGTYSVFRYEDCQAILKDHELWSVEGRNQEGVRPDAPRDMLSSDPPAHTRLRNLVSQAFTPRMVEQLEPRIRAVARELLDEFAGRPEADLVDALAYPLPVIMIAEILGVPASDRGDFRRWSNDVVATLGSGVSGGGPEIESPAIGEMTDYFTALIEKRRQDPKDDLLSGLVAAELDGSKLTGAEMIAMLILLLVAGNETTTNLIGNAIQEFIARPAVVARLRQEPGALPAALEEVLRLNSPVQATARRATRDAGIAGTAIPQGSLVVAWLASANRDERAFPDAETFDIDRNPNRHLAFGHGIHFCLGAPLARLEARVALEEFLARYRSFARVDEAPLPRVPTFIMRGVRTLPLRLEA